ncbi:MAG: citrate lyase subunit beta [Propionibacteriaceae bacterium]|jgi:citrate lyase subunit beta/citryl-CoA lyase|nr:citrate lyase subunit beta [Propionibacteriaceae bacterium]
MTDVLNPPAATLDAAQPAWGKYDQAAAPPHRSALFVPASNAAMLATAWVYGADLYMFDLEDAVALREKDSARLLAINALTSYPWRDMAVAVRVNGIDTPFFADDLQAVVRAGADMVRLPMTDSAELVHRLDAELTAIERACSRPVGSTKVIAAIESAAGVVNASAIALASPRVVAIALAGFDYLLDMGAEPTQDGSELFYARCAVLHAARAAGVWCYDVVWGDVDDEAGFRAEVELVKHLGFDGKTLVNPRQIPWLHEAYSPTAAELARAERVVRAAEAARDRGLGVIAVDGKMVDGPIVQAARRAIAYAAASGVREDR